MIPLSAPSARPVGAPTPALLSPQQAADRAQVSRRTVMRAVEQQELPGRRDNRNRWNISQEDLDNWAHAHWARSAQRPEDAQAIAQPQDALDLAVARATIAQMEARLEDQAAASAALVDAAEARARAAEIDRDHWRDLAGVLAARPGTPAAAIPNDPSPSRRRWWRWRS